MWGHKPGLGSLDPQWGAEELGWTSLQIRKGIRHRGPEAGGSLADLGLEPGLWTPRAGPVSLDSLPWDCGAASGSWPFRARWRFRANRLPTLPPSRWLATQRLWGLREAMSCPGQMVAGLVGPRLPRGVTGGSRLRAEPLGSSGGERETGRLLEGRGQVDACFPFQTLFSEPDCAFAAVSPDPKAFPLHLLALPPTHPLNQPRPQLPACTSRPLYPPSTVFLPLQPPHLPLTLWSAPGPAGGL